MAALTITATQVLPGTVDAGADFETGTAVGTITAGQLLYKNASNQLDLCDANLSALGATIAGIALHGATAGQPIRYQITGDVTLGAGAAPAVGTIYVAGATAGAINPAADLTTGWYTSVFGVGKTGNKIAIQRYNSGQVVP